MTVKTLMGSKKTTAVGILALLIAIGNAAMSILNGEVPDTTTLWPAIIGVIGLLSKDGDQ